MAGPHPAVAATRLAVRQAFAALPSETVVTVGCSGGADSLALAAAVAFEARDRAVAVTVDHGLQDGSDVRAAAVAEQLRTIGFDDPQVVRVDVDGTGGLEAAARDARYAALDAFGYPVVLGHTLDDQAETVLLALGRGSGPRALRGMRSGGNRIRPFLGLRRADTRAACEALGLAWWDDPHNRDPRFRRARVRHEVLPLLEDVLGGGVAGALARTAAQTGEDLDLLDELAVRAGVEAGDDAVALAALPVALRRRVVKRWLEAEGAGPLSAVHIVAVDRLLTDWHGQDVVPLPGGVGVQRVSGRLAVMPSPRPVTS